MAGRAWVEGYELLASRSLRIYASDDGRDLGEKGEGFWGQKGSTLNIV